jgi:two-component system sensor histidine kinase CiaH
MSAPSATVKLTIAYLAILMIISIAFSVAVYRTSVAALEEGFLHQVEIFQNRQLFARVPMRGDLERARLEELELGRHSLALNLLGINVAILVLGGMGSYFLAQRTLQPIEAALDAQSRFTADASHELRTPLTAMQTEIEVALRDGNLKVDEARQLLQSNLEEVAKLRALTDGLLTLSRHQRGEAISVSQLAADKVIKGALKRLQPIIAEQQAKVETKDSKLKLEGDGDSLTSLLVILIENAIKYGGEQPQVVVSATAEHHRAVIRVTDQGVGIKAGDLPHIFDRFYRADGSRSKTTSGYGLGLAIAKQIVDMHQGNIAATSTPGKGTTITVRLPLKQSKLQTSLG